MKKPTVWSFFMYYLKCYGINKKNMFSFFINYLKTETRKKSEKNYTNVFSRPVTSYIYLFIILKHVELIKRFHNKTCINNMFWKVLIIQNRMYSSKIVIGREK